MNTQQKIDEIQQSYDETPYVSIPFPESHPYHLQATCQLVGLETPDYRKAKVLEIGCSFGGNIISMAIHNPEMEITGVDLSEFQINEGKKIIETVGLTNIELIQADINQYQVPENYFDYIICHGVFSWVPEEVQESILKVIQKGLTDNGVAYVSYNTYPGWKINEFYREAMLFATKDIEDGNEKYKKAMETLDFLKENMVDGAFAYDLKRSYDLLKNSNQYYIRHEYLEGVNKPLYFYQFADKLKQNKLIYVDDADISGKYKSTFLRGYNALEVESYKNIVNEEQRFDFIKQNTFRKSIITKKHNLNNINFSCGYPDLDKLFIASKSYSKLISNVKFQKEFIDTFSTKQERDIAHLIMNELINNSCCSIAEIKRKLINNKSNQCIGLLDRIVITLLWKKQIILMPYLIQGHQMVLERPYIKKEIRDFIEYLYTNEINWVSYGSIYHFSFTFDSSMCLIIPLLDGCNNCSDIFDEIKNKITITDNKSGELLETNSEKFNITLKDHIQGLLKKLAKIKVLD